MEQDFTHELYETHCRPALMRMLKAVGLDVVYTRAKGNYLWMKTNDGESIKVLDFIGSYGASIFGHYHPKLVQTLQQLISEETPVFVQASVRSGAGMLAAKLNELLGDYKVTLTNSGTEAIEAAIKHVLLERKQRLFWSVKKSFHGKTLGSIQLTEEYRSPFEIPCFPVHFINPDRPELYEQFESEAQEVAAIIVEPVQGEGGIRPLPSSFVQWINKIATQYDIPVIVDEIQSGMGRTGTLLYADQIALKRNYVCLSKSLGGGLVKIGAMLVQSKRYVKDFSIIHTSTFAEDELSSRIALRSLELLEEEQIAERCRQQGELFHKKLITVQARFPKVIADLRCAGLLIGIELHKQDENSSKIIRSFSINERLAALASGYFLNEHRIRIAPTLSNPFTLRLQPSAFISEEEMDQFIEALNKFCHAVDLADGAHLINFLVGRLATPVRDYRDQPPLRREAPNALMQVAFIGHLIEAKDLKIWDISLQLWEDDQLEMLVERFSSLIKPQVYEQINVRSATGEAVHMSFIGLFLHSKQIEKAYRDHKFDWIIDLINEAVEVAKIENCKIVGFGGYTSILTSNCKRVKDLGLTLTSGNSLTVGFGYQALCKVAKQKEILLSTATVGVVGAKGNIASIYTKLIASEVHRLILFVRKKDDAEVINLLHQLKDHYPEKNVTVEEDLDRLNECNLIIASSNSAKPIIFPKHLQSDGPVLICDISVPSNVHKSVHEQCPNVQVILGGIVKLPVEQHLSISGIPLRNGHIFACMGETLLMGLQNGYGFKGSVGAISKAHINDALELARRHGFEVEYNSVIKTI